MTKANSFAHRYALVFTSLSFLITACGGVAPPGDPAEKTLTLDPDPAKTIPAPNAIGVSITAPLSFAVLEDLEPSSVNSSNVHLMPGTAHDMDAGDDGSEEDATMMSTDPIPGDVTYDAATKTIKFVPRYAMEQGRMYHIHASNLLLKGGKKAATGTDTINYSFTTSHAHEFYRIEYDDNGQKKEERYTKTTNNKRVERKQYEYENNQKVHDYTRHYGATHTFPGKSLTDTSVYWQEDASGGIQRYEVKRTGADGVEYNVRVRFKEPYPQSASIATDPVHSIWTPGQLHGGHHEISYQYEPANDDTPTPWPVSGNPTTDPSFQLDDAQLMEMDHSQPTSGATNPNQAFQHRHIFYGDLGDNGEIDFNSDGNPEPQDDRVAVYHTRDLVNYQRTHEWSWFGEDRRSRVKKFGADGQLFTNDDVAYQLRVYIYDTLGRRAQRVTYEVPRQPRDASPRDQAPYGLTRSEWEQVLQSSGYLGYELGSYGVTTVTGDNPAFRPTYSPVSPNGVPIKVHSYRIYEYAPDSQTNDPTTGAALSVAGSLEKVTVWHENSTNTALIKEQVRYYTTQPDADGEQLALTVQL
jgi:hypothetical protein